MFASHKYQRGLELDLGRHVFASNRWRAPLTCFTVLKINRRLSDPTKFVFRHFFFVISQSDGTSATMIPQSRRACYKCGNVGHYAEVCSSNERLCYNCKQPGHESNNCPEEHTSAAKQCYNCQGMGHISSECPNPVVNGARCYGCGQTGHLAVHTAWLINDND